MDRQRNRASLPIALFFMTFVFLVSACSGKPDARQGNVAPTASVAVPQEKPFSYTMRSISKIYNNGRNSGDEQSYCKCRYPVFSGGAHADDVNRMLQSYIADSTAISPGDGKSRGGKSIELLADEFLKDYEGFRKEFGSELPYQFDLSCSVPLNRPGYLTVDISWDAYTGGAHGMHHTEFLVFDTATGKRLKPEDVFVPGFATVLNRLIDAKFRQMKGLLKTERLDGEKGTLFENVIRHNDNFALGDKGIVFFYNEYEIAAYAFGPTEIELVYGELQDILKPAFRSL